MGEAQLTTQLLTLQRAAGVKRGGQGAIVEIVELAADRDTLGQARQLDPAAGEAVGKVMRGGLALDGGVQRQDQFLAGFDAGDEPVDRQILGTDPVERRQGSAEHVIPAAKGAGALERPEIGQILDDADRGTVAPRVAADGARLDGVEIAADRTRPDRLGRLANAAANGVIRLSRRLIRCNAARRAERGPSPGNFASSWIRVSSSDKSTE